MAAVLKSNSEQAAFQSLGYANPCRGRPYWMHRHSKLQIFAHTASNKVLKDLHNMNPGTIILRRVVLLNVCSGEGF
jgi:hypothetical protein